MIIGIDLGTTNSAVAIWRDGKAELIPNAMGHVLTPSAVGLDEDGSVLVGLPARERQSTHPHLTATTFKRYMGSRRETKLGKKNYYPEELSALVLAKLKADAEAYLGQKVTEAVIAVPAYFNDHQRKATRRAGQLAGLTVDRLINEPTAAALSHGIHELAEPQRFLVFDLGGGTFDVSVLEIFEGIIEVRSTTGDNRLGGEDFNDALAAAFVAQHRSALGAWAEGERTFAERVKVAAERARRELSNAPNANMSVTWQDKAYEMAVSGEKFEELCGPLLERLRDPVRRALRDANLQASDLKEVFLIGGATRMPIVRRMVTKLFGRFPSIAINPDEAVALGAAVQAGLKSRDKDLKEVVLTDVAPFSLGIEVGEEGPGGQIRTGLFSPIIERNTVIPASRLQSYGTMRDQQREISFGIYQGESREVADNVRLGELTIPVPPRKRGEVGIDVRFTYDINGLLEVDVSVPMSGVSKQLVIVDQAGMSEQEVAERRTALAALKVHPRDQDANKAALARAKRCYEETLGGQREYVAHLITQFENVLAAQDPRAVEEARKELMAALDQFDGGSFL